MYRQRSSHPFAVAVLLGLAALVGFVAIGSIWANRQLLDTGSWVAASGRMLESREVRHRLAAFLADELLAEAEARLGAAGEGEVAAEVLPPLRREAPRLAERVMRTRQFRVVWLRANRTGHRALVRILDEEGTASNGDGAVVIDLTPALRELAESLSRSELASALGVENLAALVEPGAARIEVLEAEELEAAQDVVRAIRHLPVPATIAFLVLVGLALLLGRARLWRTVGWAGLSLIAAGALALLARAIAGHEIVDALLARDADREAAEAAWSIATSEIGDLSVAAIGLGGLIALFALLLGESAPAVAVRRALEPLLRTPLARLWMLLLAVLAVLALIAWAPIAALERPLGIALFAAVILGGAVALARGAATAEPDAHPGAP
jgi:hypothetical protein